MVDALSSGGSAARCAGSNPVPGTKAFLCKQEGFFLLKKLSEFVMPDDEYKMMILLKKNKVNI